MKLGSITQAIEPRIAVMISDPADRREILTALNPFARAHLCLSSHDLRASIANGGVTGIVCECRDSYGLPLESRVLIGSAGIDVPTLIFVRPTQADVSFYCDIVHAGVPALARIPSQTKMGDVVRYLIERRWVPEASAAIIRQIAERLKAPPGLLVMVMIAGSRRLGVSEFAELTHVSERTLQRRLAVAVHLPAVQLLNWATMLHSAWRLDVSGQRVKEAAADGGFPTREAFTSFIRRHASCTASDLSRPGSFLHTLATFLAELSRGAAFRDHRVSPARENHVASIAQ